MRLPICVVDGKPIEPHEDILREVVGWLRPQGTGGGQIVKRQDTGRFAHRACVELGPPESTLFR
jgi:hypothetical protein